MNTYYSRVAIPGGEIIGEIDRDPLGDLHVRDVHTETVIKDKVVKQRPCDLNSRSHLEEILLADYEYRRKDDHDHGESFREYK